MTSDSMRGGRAAALGMASALATDALLQHGIANAAHELFVARTLESIFDYRERAVAAHFASPATSASSIFAS